ncbi:MAG TPA: hypothetical protein P5556_08230 [Candidatus Gastranaerophilales bacterium]|nr:hypothetical protein [Candidatus Gastranaerophilales bacterium]
MNKKNKKIVIISGKQYSGKDTTANVLKTILSGFKLAPLADAIKIEFGEEKNLTFNEIERNKPLYRADLIVFGNKRRAEDNDYWIKKALKCDNNIIISDVRLQHEISAFEEYHAVKIRVEANREEREKRGKLVKEDDPTETDLDNYDNWDYIIENNGSIQELEEKAARIGKEILERLSAQKV